MRYGFIAAIALALAITTIAIAQQPAADIEVRVWQSIQNPESLYLSARPAEGSWETLGTVPLHMTGRHENSFRYGDVTVSVPLDASAPITPAPAATEGEQITVILRNPNTIAPLIEFFVISDHDIPPGQGYFVAGGWVRQNSRAILAGEEYGLYPSLDGHWQDVTGVTVRTLQGNSIRTWQCEGVADPHAIEGRYTCAIEETVQTLELENVEDASLWVYVSSGPVGNINVRAGQDDIGHVRVWLGPESLRGCTLFATSYHTFSQAGEVHNLSCRDSWRAKPTPTTDIVSTVTVATSFDPMYCDWHEASNEERAVWACETW